MTEAELEAVQESVADEGFQYAMVEYSSWQDIEDKEFHRLRTAYIAALHDLERYLQAP